MIMMVKGECLIVQSSSKIMFFQRKIDV
jgi:hypothetical protein